VTAVVAPVRRKPRLPWAPLAAALAVVEVEREPLGSNLKRTARLLDVDVRQLGRWRRDGISPDIADRICHRIERHPAELYDGWGEWA
jgi:hypothetical protein